MSEGDWTVSDTAWRMFAVTALAFGAILVVVFLTWITNQEATHDAGVDECWELGLIAIQDANNDVACIEGIYP